MADYASKGLANGIGIPALVLGSLGFLQSGGLSGNGILGGLGCNRTADTMSALQAENAMLKSENYSDKTSKEVYAQTLADNRALRDEVFAFVKPLADESAANKTAVAVLQTQIAKDQEINALKVDNCCCKMNAKIDAVAQSASCGIAQLTNAVAAINTTLAGLTKTVIPASAICPEVMPRFNSWTAPTAPATGA